jgi:hypothetical protein
MRILVQPERLRQAAQELRRAQESWQGQAARLRQVFSNLDWETRQRLEVEGQVQQAVALAESLAARAGEKAAFLEAAAARFEQADSQGAQGLGAVLGASAISALAGLNLPLGPGDWSGSRIPLTRLVPLAGGGAVTGLGLFASLTWLGSAVKGLAEQIWAWLQGRPEKFLSPVPEDEPAIPKGRLAQTILSGLEKARREQEQKQATSSGRVIQSIEVDTPKERTQPPPDFSIYHPITPQSQGDEYERAACFPTSVSMVLDYYHSRNPSNRFASRDDLIAMLDPGDGTKGKGVGLDRLNDDLSELGYTAITRPGSMDDLRNFLREGPVIVNLKVDLIGPPGSGDIRLGHTYDHSVVVKGMSDDAVLINEPWSGKEKVIDRATFEQMWGEGQNYMVIIRPQ